MRISSTTKWILLCLIIAQLCGAEGNGNSEDSPSNQAEQSQSADLSSEQTTENNVEDVPKNSVDTHGHSPQDTQQSESENPSELQPTNNNEKLEEPSQGLEPTNTPDVVATIFYVPIILTPVKLDLGIKRDTKDFNYRSTAVQCMYTPKSGRIFSEVIISDPYGFSLVIWKPKSQSEYSYEVSVYTIKDTIILSVKISMLNGTKKVFGRPFIHSNWQDITFPLGVKLLTTKQDGTKVELGPSDYILNTHCGHSFSYTFHLYPHPKCTEIKHENKTVWSYRSHYIISNGIPISGSYPTCILYTISYNLNHFLCKHYKKDSEIHNFRLWFSDGFYIDSSLENGQWKQKFHLYKTLSLPIASETDNEISLDVTLDKSTDQFDYEYYNCPNSGYSVFKIFTAKKGYKFASVTEQNLVIWNNSNDQSEFSTKVVAQTSIKFIEADKQVTIHTNKDNKIFYKLREDGKWIDSKEKYRKNKLKLITLNEDGSTSEDDTSKFDIGYDFSIVNYIFKSGAKCIEVKCDDIVVWKYDSSQGESHYPQKVSFNTITGNIRILLNNRLYFYSLQGLEWNMVLQI
ncbi:SfiI-subtelomeric fragment related protein family member, putative [Theileria annulata]|uniref:SfiI-subtelomeric related protein family member, putative n=1 Tax=Theileria annulata TaxID=5874 RepID=Q4UFF3_THEAN|nr:SfiI-subtelomeric fragment related protein family member, putative [Theileria annulata]CAI74163.1 SfiI-subtelomeric fragment related protein family member, putative [Theileria annulata]